MKAANKRNLLLLMPAVFSLLAGMWAGLLRMGWSLPQLQPTLSSVHGPLMVSGFLGTVIGLERVVALSLTVKGRWLYIGPSLTAAGALLLSFGLASFIGPLLVTVGSSALFGMFVIIVRRQLALHTVVMLLGAVAWVVGNLLWLFGFAIYQVVWWWVGFFVLTIAGERLELARLTGTSQTQRAIFMAAITLLVGALLLAKLDYTVSVRIGGVALAIVAVWLFRNDIARRTLKRPGQARFTAWCLLTGYGWLAVGAALAIAYGGVTAGLQYDAMLHAILLGFVFAMIFGHAPIIFPGVLGRPMKFSHSFYAHLALLHASLIVRLAGDLAGWLPVRQWGGLLNVLMLLLFLASTMRALRPATPLPPSAID